MAQTTLFNDALLGSTFGNRSLAAKLREFPSAFDYIDSQYHSGIVDGTGSYDATTDLNAALTAEKILVLNRGTYKTSDTINGTTCSVYGMPGTTISRTNSLGAVFRAGGSYREYNGFNIEFATFPGDVSTAVGVEFYALRRSRMSNMRIQKTWAAMYIPEVNVGAVAGADNFIYSVSFDNMQILNFFERGIHLHAFNGGNTGCVFNNIYINGEDFSGGKRRPVTCVSLDYWSEIIFNQLNIEHVELGNCAIQFGSSVNTASVRGLHCEGVDPYSNTFDGMIRLNGATQLSIDGFVYSYSNILEANIGGTTYPLFKLASNSQIKLDNFNERNNTKSAGMTFSIANYAGSLSGVDTSIEGTNIKTSNMNTVINNQPSGIRPILKKWNLVRDKIVGTITGTSAVSLNATSPQSVLIRDTAMSADQNIDLTTATPPDGHRLIVMRTANATGAFNLTINSTLAVLSNSGSSVELAFNSGSWYVINPTTNFIRKTDKKITSNYTLTAQDNGYTIICTSSLTLTAPAIGTLGNGFSVEVLADGATVTVDGPGSINYNMVDGDMISIMEVNGKQRIVGGSSIVIS